MASLFLARSWSPSTLLLLDGESLRRLTIEERKRALSRLLGVASDGLSLSECFEDDGARIFGHICRLGLEGIVSKRRGSPYVSGRTAHWIKTRSASYERL